MATPESPSAASLAVAPPPARLRVAPIIMEAQEAFLHDLDRLLNERPGQWVAYHGPRQIDFAPTDIALYEKCQRLGIPDRELLIRCVEPENSIVLLGPRAMER